MKTIATTHILLAAVLMGMLLITAPLATRASNATCEEKIFVNDPMAEVRADGVLVARGSTSLPCQLNARQIHIVSSDGQSFSRVLQAANGNDIEKLGPRLALNVLFRPKAGRYEDGGAMRSYVERGTNRRGSDAVLQELRELRQLVKTLMASNQPALKNTVKPERMMASENFAAGTSSVSEPHRRLSGYYIQIHTMTGPARAELMMKELKEKGLSGQRVRLCVWRTPDTNEARTRALWGPFETFKDASEIHQRIGRDVFVLRKDPFCDD